MYTRCPSCRAAFSISQQQLEIAAGVVRCGICEHVFDAKLFLFNQEPRPAEADNGADNEITDVIEAVDLELNSGPHTTIDLEILDRDLHDHTSTADEDIIGTEQTKGHSECDTAESETGHSGDDKVIPKIIADQVSSLEKPSPKIKPVQWLGMVTLIVLLAFLGIQTVAAFKANIIPSSYQGIICQWLKCSVELPRALDKIEVLNRSIHTHPTEPQALMVTLTIINRAPFTQPYPVIQLLFLNTSGDIIAARQFSPNHYLQEEWSADRLMASMTPLSIQLEVHDVGEEVVSYNFDFF